MDPLAPFTPDFALAIAAQAKEPRRKLACLDADGTLWSEDLGEAFLRWLAAGELLPNQAGKSQEQVYSEYEARVAEDRALGFAWAVQCMAALAESDVRRWARQLAFAWPNYRPAMRALVELLTRSNYEVWIVSASNQWIVEAAAPYLSIAASNVIGIRVEVSNDELTAQIVPPIVCEQGKVEAVLKTIGRAPDLAIGDSQGDVAMLESARLPLVVSRKDHPNKAMLALAHERRWPIHLF